MLNFIVLGYVPGTSIQITFDDFLVFLYAFTIILISAWYFVSIAVRRELQRIMTIHMTSL